MEFTYSQVESLNETETYVYNYVVKNTKKVLNESIRELANNTHVSTATVMRFCKKMGCEGFTELKYRLKESEEVQETDQEEKNDFYDYIKNKHKDLADKAIIESTGSGGRVGIHEVLKKGTVEKLTVENRVGSEMVAINNLLEEILGVLQRSEFGFKF